MGQIKNIKLHIVTDIKVTMSTYWMKTWSMRCISQQCITKQRYSAKAKDKLKNPPVEVSYAIKLERINELKKSPSGWAPPVNPTPSLPFHITRTRNNRVPVFIQEKNGTLFTTITKVRGNEEELEKYVRSRLGE